MLFFLFLQLFPGWADHHHHHHHEIHALIDGWANKYNRFLFFFFSAFRAGGDSMIDYGGEEVGREAYIHTF